MIIVTEGGEVAVGCLSPLSFPFCDYHSYTDELLYLDVLTKFTRF
jgi:hypothetical protein